MTPETPAAETPATRSAPEHSLTTEQATGLTTTERYQVAAAAVCMFLAVIVLSWGPRLVGIGFSAVGVFLICLIFNPAPDTGDADSKH